MDFYTIIILVGTGLLAGILSGILGIGGGIVIIPALVYLLGVGQLTAQGTSLAILLPPIGLFAAYTYYKAGHVNLKYAIIIAVLFMIGSIIGSKFVVNIPEDIVKKIFGIFIVALGAKMIIWG